ncbi:DUF2599 domain-containing protein [Gordonia crocea]|uniref:DUF2599 domain-containing protein n=1 Tax=Gordonia crocea TaxID=589162 RepID=A0A7I9V0P8_9ACTN|nr:DUF2599 domain-containing protein [Gordonia crocea]GED99027.1 hypothetical protein nbrc107697_30660 [Gordonia crocea]
MLRGAVLAGATLALLAVAGCGGEASPPAPAASSAPAVVDGSTGEPSPSEPVVYLPPPYIARTVWAQTAVGPSLQVYPTVAGRRVTDPAAQGKAWREVVALSARYGRYSATSPGMRAQFDCHWVWARAVQPDKPSWNLEPGRPVVSEDQMIAARCNPGAPEE